MGVGWLSPVQRRSPGALQETYSSLEASSASTLPKLVEVHSDPLIKPSWGTHLFPYYSHAVLLKCNHIYYTGNFLIKNLNNVVGKKKLKKPMCFYPRLLSKYQISFQSWNNTGIVMSAIFIPIVLKHPWNLNTSSKGVFLHLSNIVFAGVSGLLQGPDSGLVFKDQVQTQSCTFLSPSFLPPPFSFSFLPNPKYSK